MPPACRPARPSGVTLCPSWWSVQEERFKAAIEEGHKKWLVAAMSKVSRKGGGYVQADLHHIGDKYPEKKDRFLPSDVNNKKREFWVGVADAAW